MFTWCDDTAATSWMTQAQSSSCPWGTSITLQGGRQDVEFPGTDVNLQMISQSPADQTDQLSGRVLPGRLKQPKLRTFSWNQLDHLPPAGAPQERGCLGLFKELWEAAEAHLEHLDVKVSQRRCFHAKNRKEEEPDEDLLH